MIIITIIGIINREKLNYTCTHTHGPKIVGVRTYPRRLVNLGLGLRSQRLHLFDSARLEIVLNFCTTFQSITIKTKASRDWPLEFLCSMSRLHVFITSSSHWLSAIITFSLIGCCDCFRCTLLGHVISFKLTQPITCELKPSTT